jgi:hypothetical protein
VQEPVSVEVDDIVSRVSASGEETLSPRELQRIVSAVVAAMRAELAHDERRKAEQEPLGNARHRGLRR